MDARINRNIALVGGGFIIGAMILTACGSDPADGGTNVGYNDSAKVVVIDGVQCVVANGNRSTAISCNWEAYNAGR